MRFTSATNAIGRLVAGVALAAGVLAGAAPAPAHAAGLLAPDLRAASPRPGGTIRLTWRDANAATLINYRIHRYVDGGSLYGPGWQLDDIPPRKDGGGLATFDATGLMPGTTYCFMVYAVARQPNDDILSHEFSPASNTRCARAESGAAVPGPINPNTKAPAPYQLPRPGGTDILVLKPDFVAGITGPATVKSGVNTVYYAKVRNDGGDARGTVALTITSFGALAPLDTAVVSADAGLACEAVRQLDNGVTGQFRCTGGSLNRGQSATVQFRVRGAKTGTGNLAVEANPNRNVDESDYSNNRRVLAVTVQ